MVGAVGFEPTTSCSQGRRANQAALRPDNVVGIGEKWIPDTGFSGQAQHFFNFLLTGSNCYANKGCFEPRAVILLPSD